MLETLTEREREFIKTLRGKLKELDEVRDCYVRLISPKDFDIVTLLIEDTNRIFFKVYDIEGDLMDNFPEMGFDYDVSLLSEENYIELRGQDFSKHYKII